MWAFLGVSVAFKRIAWDLGDPSHIVIMHSAGRLEGIQPAHAERLRLGYSDRIHKLRADRKELCCAFRMDMLTK